MGIMGGIIVSINPNPSGVMLDCGMAATWLDSNTGKNVKSVSGISNDFKQMCMLGNWCSLQYLFYYNSTFECSLHNFCVFVPIFGQIWTFLREKNRLDIAVRMNFRNFSGRPSRQINWFNPPDEFLSRIRPGPVGVPNKWWQAPPRSVNRMRQNTSFGEPTDIVIWYYMPFRWVVLHWAFLLHLSCALLKKNHAP